MHHARPLTYWSIPRQSTKHKHSTSYASHQYEKGKAEDQGEGSRKNPANC